MYVARTRKSPVLPHDDGEMRRLGRSLSLRSQATMPRNKAYRGSHYPFKFSNPAVCRSRKLANFWDDVTNTSGLFKVNTGSAATFFGTFSGNGITGNASEIHFEADISPGFSPASVPIAGNVSLGAAARLMI
jgi:hypothetical protein